MLKVDVHINEDAIKRKILDAAEKQVRDKLQMKGIHSVIVKAVAIEDGGVRFQFVGDDAEIKKAKAALGYQT